MGKIVFISGASSGIGEATAKKLAEMNYTVVLGARRIEQLERIKKNIEAEGGSVSIFQLDVTNFENFNHVISKTISQFGSIDVLINNAGVMPISYLEELKINEWNQMIDVNIRGVLHGIAAVLPHMKDKKNGHIINISSIAGHKVMPSTAVYSATKFAVRAISEGLKAELKGLIKTTTICPGYVKTNLADTISNPEIKGRVEKAHESALQAEDIANSIAYAVAQPESVAVDEIIISTK